LSVLKYSFIAIFFFLIWSSSSFGQSDTIYHVGFDTVIILNTIKVEAYQISQSIRDISGSISIVSTKELSQNDGTNLANILNTLPGITMQSGTYATNRIVIRGMGSRTPYNTNRIRTYLNDIPITSIDGISSPEEIDLNVFGRIEIIKGPSSALYGSGLGGTVNLYTKNIQSKSGAVSSQYGSFNTKRINITGNHVLGKVSIGGNFNHLKTDGYRDNNQYLRNSAIFTLNRKASRSEIDALILFVGSTGEIPSSIGKTLFETNPKAAAPNWQAIGGFKSAQKLLTGITLTNRLSTESSNRLTLFGRWNDNYEKRPFNNLDDHSYSYGIRDKLTLHTKTTDIIAGFEWITEQYYWKLDKDASLLNENKERRNQLNLFAIAYYRPTPKINISAALAANKMNYQLTDLYLNDGDRSGKRSFPIIVSPRLGINYSINQNISLYASAGHGYSHPSPEEALLPEGNINPEIKPEQGVQIEAGSRFSLLNDFLYFDISFYHIDLKYLLITKRLTEDIFTGINAGKTRHEGVELQFSGVIFKHSIFPGELTSNVSFTWGNHRFIDFTDNGQNHNGNQLPGIPDKTAFAKISWKPMKNWEIETSGIFNGQQYLNDANTLQQTRYALLNFKNSVRVPLRQFSIDLFAGINNFLNTRYASMVVVNAIAFGNSEPRYYYPGQPRNVYLGVKFNF
jgi:iron complex outermembrane receptor protein